MRISLKHRPVAANGPRFAADIAGAARDISGEELDYTVESLRVADRLISEMSQAAPSVDAVAATLVGFGAYLGEVLVRQGGGEWVDFDEAQRELFGHPFGVCSPSGHFWNPLEQAFRRFVIGPEVSLEDFCRRALGSL